MTSNLARVLVCGGRDYRDFRRLIGVLDELCREKGWVSRRYEGDDLWLPNVVIVSGKAPGADTMALEWAVVNFCPTLEFPADWDAYGKAAGPIRNQRMIDEGKPELVVAFPGGRGTADMVRKAKAAGIEVMEINP